MEGEGLQRILNSEEEGETVTERKEELVPIRLNVLVDNYRLQDTLTWNLSLHFIDDCLDLLEDRLTPEAFAETFCAEMGVPAKVESYVASSIRQQLDAYHHFKSQRSQSLQEREGTQGQRVGENIFVIRLDISLNGVTLLDQFEWDISNPLNSPEAFAASLGNDLGLSREFVVAIAHSIREQIIFYLNGQQPSLRSSVEYYQRPSPVKRGIRDLSELPHWTPVVGTHVQLAEVLKRKAMENYVWLSPFQTERLKLQKKEMKILKKRRREERAKQRAEEERREREEEMDTGDPIDLKGAEEEPSGAPPSEDLGIDPRTDLGKDIGKDLGKEKSTGRGKRREEEKEMTSTDETDHTDTNTEPIGHRIVENTTQEHRTIENRIATKEENTRKEENEEVEGEGEIVDVDD